MTTRERISYLEERIEEMEKHIDLMREENGDVDVDLIVSLQELQDSLRFAWEDDEREYHYAVELQMFNDGCSLLYY